MTPPPLEDSILVRGAPISGTNGLLFHDGDRLFVTSALGDEIVEMDRMRKLIAENMVYSKHVSAHVTSFVEADVTAREQAAQELDDDGELVVTYYKTGRAPSPNWERKSLSGVHFYSFLCESVFGRRPAAIRLMYLKSGETITATPSEQSTRFMTTRTSAVWKAVATACERDDFRPRPGRCARRPV